MPAASTMMKSASNDTSSLRPHLSLKSRSAKFWDRQAARYARSKISDEAGYERSIARTRSLLSGNELVVEIGCGTGSTALRHAGDAREIIATDISAQMIAIAKTRAAERDASNVSFVVAPSDEMVVDADAADVVMAHNILHLVPNVEATIAHAHAMLSPGGLFISKTPCLSEMSAPMRWLVIPAMKRLFRLPVLRRMTVADLEAAITRQGFAIEAVEDHDSSPKGHRPYIIARKPTD